MKRFSEQFNKQANHIRLQSAERSDLRERLVSYMEYHPLTAQAKQSSPVIPLNNEAYRTVRIDLSIISKFVGAFVVLTLIVVPVFAENTVPGDILYPVKVKFNEELRSSLTFSPYERIEWETTRLERRISEAQLLANAGLLTPEVEAKVALAVKTHSNAAQQEIANLGITNVADAAIAKIALNSALEVQTEVLASQLNKNKDNSSTTLFGRSVSAIAAVVGEAKSNNSSTIDFTTLSKEKLLAYLESETTRAYEYLDSVKSVASVDERNDIRRRMNDVNKKIGLAVGEDRQVTDTDLLISAISDTRKLISFMTNIDVRASVSVEDLVPMVLTEEEHLVLIAEKNGQLNELSLMIDSKIENVPLPIREKIDLSLIKVNELKSTASTSALAKDFISARISLNEALLIMVDIARRTNDYESVLKVKEPDSDKATSSEGVTPDIASTTERAIF